MEQNVAHEITEEEYKAYKASHKDQIHLEQETEEFQPPLTNPHVKAEVKEEEPFSRVNLTEIETPKETEERKSRNFIRNFMAYIKSNRFTTTCAKISKEKGVSKKQVAKNFLDHVLGTISDVFHIVIDTIEDVLTTVLDVLAKVLISGVKIVCSVASKLVRIVTLNKTCVE